MGKSSELKPDICVIGMDPAGIELAFAAAGLGVPVVLVTQIAAEALLSGQQDALQRLRALGVGVLADTGHFVDRKRLAVGPVCVRARRYVLATPATARMPDIRGLQSVPHWSGPQAAAQLLVIGGNASGVATAQAARQSGAKVALICADRLLPDFDTEAVGILRVALERQGIQLRENATLSGALVAPDDIPPAGHGDAQAPAHSPVHVMTFPDGAGPILFTRIFLDCGQDTIPEGLGIDAARIAGRDGRLVVNAGMETSNSRVLAIGAAGGRMTAKENRTAEAGAALGALLFRRKPRLYPALATRAVQAGLAIAEIGLSETSLQPGEAASLRFYRAPLAQTGSGGPKGEGVGPILNAGHIKVIATRGGIIRGVSILAGDALELIPVFQLVMARGIKVEALAELPVAAPAHAEAIGQIARQALRARLQTPGTARLIRFLRLFG
jgi:pyruvate/2-oxoglutarate dehydrogenase complex dihydrolipoamide dehydrogenase (E3) component